MNKHISNKTSVSDAEYLSLHKATCVFIGYTNPGMRFAKNHVDVNWFAEEDSRVQGGLKNLRRGSVDIATVSVGIPLISRGSMADAYANPDKLLGPVFGPVCSVDQTLQMLLKFLDGLTTVIEANSQDAAIAKTISEAEQINADGKMAIILGLTGAWINNDLAVLRSYYRLGVRVVHICVEGLDGIGDPSDDFVKYHGLSECGRQVVHEMNRLGMVIDVAHASDESARQIVELSSKPVISSHTCCRNLCDIRRNLPDDLIIKIAEKGGVIGLHFASSMLDQRLATSVISDDYFKAYQARQDALLAKYPDPYEFLAAFNTFETEDDIAARTDNIADQQADIGTLIDHIDHVVNIAGIEHVGIGSDYDIGGPAKGLENAGKLSNLTQALIQRGYSKEDILKIWGNNFKRAYRDAIGR